MDIYDLTQRYCSEHQEQKAKEIEITIEGRPGHPVGDAGKEMLERMNHSHEMITNCGLDHLDIKKTAPLFLDIGCGGGATLRRLLDRYPGAIVYGVDYSDASVELSRQNNADAIADGKIIVVHGDVSALPFDNDSFDAIITVESFYFWPDPTDNLKEVRRVLKPGGQFLLISDLYDNGALTSEDLIMAKYFNLRLPTEKGFLYYFSAAGFNEIQIHKNKDNDTWICVKGSK